MVNKKKLKCFVAFSRGLPEIGVITSTTFDGLDSLEIVSSCTEKLSLNSEKPKQFALNFNHLKLVRKLHSF